MKPGIRKIAKWRKKSPASHRSYAEKRNRMMNHAKEEIDENFRKDVEQKIEFLRKNYYGIDN
ncbi:MAG: hypothetical protein EOM67_16495 [Spirochaetia bacterium]|nr:hypothetical protein [Spirochaetia bacterium]